MSNNKPQNSDQIGAFKLVKRPDYSMSYLCTEDVSLRGVAPSRFGGF